VRNRVAHLVAAIAAACVVGIPGIAYASSSVPVTAQVTGGTLSVTLPSTMSWSLTLNGYNQTATTSSTVVVDDSTGTGDGWQVTAEASPFTATNSSGTTTTLSGESLSVAQPTAACASGTTCTLPDNTVSYPVTLPIGSNVNVTPIVIASAAVDTGMGEVDLPFTWSLAVPADALAGSYTSTITVSVSTGP
jgi:hypothetical protein